MQVHQLPLFLSAPLLCHFSSKLEFLQTLSEVSVSRIIFQLVWLWWDWGLPVCKEIWGKRLHWPASPTWIRESFVQLTFLQRCFLFLKEKCFLLNKRESEIPILRFKGGVHNKNRKLLKNKNLRKYLTNVDKSEHSCNNHCFTVVLYVYACLLSLFSFSALGYRQFLCDHCSV